MAYGQYRQRNRAEAHSVSSNVSHLGNGNSTSRSGITASAIQDLGAQEDEEKTAHGEGLTANGYATPAYPWQKTTASVTRTSRMGRPKTAPVSLS